MSNFEQIFPYSKIDKLKKLYLLKFESNINDLIYDLSCCHENDELIFQSPNFGDCIVFTTGISVDISKINHSVYPNPFSHSTVIMFDYSSSQSYTLQIFNSTGQLIKRIVDINSGKVEISGEQLNSGIYFYQLTNDKNVIVSGKLIKNK